MPKLPLKRAEVRPPFIKPDADFDVWIGGFGAGRNDRITVIKTAVVTRDDRWEKVDRGRILLAGSVKPDLIRLLERHGRDQINKATATEEYRNGLFGGSAFDRLRQQATSLAAGQSRHAFDQQFLFSQGRVIAFLPRMLNSAIISSQRGNHARSHCPGAQLY